MTPKLKKMIKDAQKVFIKIEGIDHQFAKITKAYLRDLVDVYGEERFSFDWIKKLPYPTLWVTPKPKKQNRIVVKSNYEIDR